MRPRKVLRETQRGMRTPLHLRALRLLIARLSKKGQGLPVQRVRLCGRRPSRQNRRMAQIKKSPEFS